MIKMADYECDKTPCDRCKHDCEIMADRSRELTEKLKNQLYRVKPEGQDEEQLKND